MASKRGGSPWAQAPSGKNGVKPRSAARGGNAPWARAPSGKHSGGERGIRTPDTAFGPYNDLANRRLQPLGHLSAGWELSLLHPYLKTQLLRLNKFGFRDEKDGALWRIRTTGLLIRSQMLYPAELRARTRGDKVPNLETFSRQPEK